MPSEIFDEAIGLLDKQSVRLLKSVAIAKSGVYGYLKRELSGFDNLGPIPDQYQSRQVFSVFRPPEVLDSARSLFVRQPVTVDHPPAFVDGNNFRTYTVGWTGDDSDLDMVKDSTSGEVVVRSTLTLVDNQALEAYNNGIREVSPGYKAKFAWQSGVSDSGEEYQIVMTEIYEVNHVAIVRRGRGGADAAILDSRSDDMTEEDKKSLLEGFVGAISGLFKGKVVIDAEPVAITLDSLPDDPKDFTEDHTRFLLGLVRDSAMATKKEVADEEALTKPEEKGPEVKEEEAIDKAPSDKGLKEKASVEGEEQRVTDSASVFTAQVQTSNKKAFDIRAFDAQFSGKGGK